MSLFTLKIFLRNTAKGPPPRCMPQGPHHPRSTPVCNNHTYQYIVYGLFPKHNVIIKEAFMIIHRFCNDSQQSITDMNYGFKKIEYYPNNSNHTCSCE